MATNNDPGSSAKARKQRRRLADADNQKRRKLMSAHLSEDLMLEYDRRSMPVREGDTVRVTRGDFAGQEGEVLGVDRKRLELEIDGITNRSADGQQVPRPIHPSNVTITDLHLTDPKRRAAIERKGVEVEVPPEPEPEPEEAPEEAEQPDEAPEPEPAPDAVKGPAPPEPEPEADEAPEPDAATDEGADAEQATEDAPEPEPATDEGPDEADAEDEAEPEPDEAPEADEAEADDEPEPEPDATEPDEADADVPDEDETDADDDEEAQS